MLESYRGFETAADCSTTIGRDTISTTMFDTNPIIHQKLEKQNRYLRIIKDVANTVV